MKWRMDKKCADCPFACSGKGLHLRKSLGKGRWKSILDDLRQKKHFSCHKTTTETGNGTNLICAGAIEWQNKRGLYSTLQQLMERFELMKSA